MAMGLLTRIPMTSFKYGDSDGDMEEVRSRSILFYPVVGLLLGCLLIFVEWILPNSLSVLVKSAVLLIAWVVLTGALHLDGFADSIDAAFASHKGLDKEKVLEVFKDPNTGAMAVIALVLLLLLKLSLIASLVDQKNSFYGWFIASAVLSRLLAVIYIYCTPYARTYGIASGFDLKLYSNHILGLCAAVALVTYILEDFFMTILLILLMGALLYAWRFFWLKRIHGYTGDCIGALIEMTEILVLFVWATTI